MTKREPLQRLLAMDTSTSMLTVALLEGQHLLKEHAESADRNHANKLIPVIQQLVSEQGIQMKELDGIGTGVGPGSYTGTRIAVTAAKTLAWSLKLPLLTVSSLEAMARSFLAQQYPLTGRDSAKPCWILPMMNARRGQAFTSLYVTSPSEEGFVPMSEDAIMDVGDWLSQVFSAASESQWKGERVASPQSIHLVGEMDPFLDIFTEVSAAYPHLADRIQWQAASIHAYQVGLLAQRQWMNGQVADTHAAIPNYTQLAEAEVKWQAKQKSTTHD